MYDLEDIKNRLLKKQPISVKEFVYYLDNTQNALFAFLIETTSNPKFIKA